MTDAQPVTTRRDRILKAIKQVLGYTLVGALVTGVPVGLYVALGPTSPGTSQLYSVMLSPFFAIPAALIGAMLGFFVGCVRALHTLTVH